MLNPILSFASSGEIRYPDGPGADHIRLKLDKAWNYATGKGVNAAIIDAGANLYDPAISSNIKGVYNADTGSTDWSDVHDVSETHGTSCAKKLVSVAPDVNLYIIKAGADGYIYTEQVIKGIQWARMKKCRVVSISSGGSTFLQEEYDAIEELYRAPLSGLVCASGGNTGKNEYHYAASYDNTLSVGAATYQANSGKYAVIPKGTYNDKMDVVAPGSTTSAAAPFAAGAAALLFELNPSMTAETCRNLMQTTAQDLGVSGKDPYSGYGLIQPYTAVKKILGITTEPGGQTGSNQNSNKPANSGGNTTAKPAKSRPGTVSATIQNYRKNGKALHRKLLVTWTRLPKADGYQIQIAKNKKYTKGLKKKTIKNNKKTSYTFSKLKKGNGYYMRIRAFRKSDNKKNVYGKWLGTRVRVYVR